MPTCQTKFHGTLTFEAEQALEVPGGLFGFPDETEFLLLELPSARPIVFIQSIHNANLCFISLPVQVIDPDYRLLLTERDRQALGYSEAASPEMGTDFLCLALLTISERRVTTANLLAPLVIDIAAHRGIQVITGGEYSHQHPFPTPRFSHSVD
jgi:flagellar assembly factor FliW